MSGAHPASAAGQPGDDQLLRIDDILSRRSWYAASAGRLAQRPPHAALEGTATCDVAIVGAGFAGLSAAIELAARGMRVRVLDARRIGSGASGRNGGQVLAGLACDMSVIERQLGPTRARQVWGMTHEALGLLARRRAAVAAAIGEDCDWRPGALTVAIRPHQLRALRQSHADAVEKYGQRGLRWIDGAELGPWIGSQRYLAGSYDPSGGHLHPLRLALGMGELAARLGVVFHENTRVLAMETGSPAALPPASGFDGTGVFLAGERGGTLIRTERGMLRARHVLLAGNATLNSFGIDPGRGRIAPRLAARVMPVGTYIVATEPLGRDRAESLIPSDAAVCDNSFVLDYFRRSADHRLLFGGRVSYSTHTPTDLPGSMRKRIETVFPQLAGVGIEHVWGGFVDITMNRAPDFGRLADDVYYVQGFSGHGVALAGLAGQLVAEAIAGTAERFDVFAALRHRNFPGGAALRTPALVLAMSWYRLRDLLG
ncbi:NAD(P)/FAD-dependent oxidoreductase [Derxia lacustris]|uniref:NAD(P)/FAD-dependent oxidoreductase n=1 Tax=Derxia lacustris TaxID=764842 RepID=UPI00111C07C8|nr:FAD-binding oxidoreductase [Derxia lacustris]